MLTDHTKYLIGRYIHIGLKYSSILLVALGLIVMGQAAQLGMSVGDNRFATINQWKADNPAKSQLADLFIERCLVGSTNKDQIPKPISIDDCATAIGAEELARNIKASDRVLKNAAWPLSIVFNI